MVSSFDATRVRKSESDAIRNAMVHISEALWVYQLRKITKYDNYMMIHIYLKIISNVTDVLVNRIYIINN